MTPADVHMSAGHLIEFLDNFAPSFVKEQAQDHAHIDSKGLMSCPGRKTIEPIALCVGTGQVPLHRAVRALGRPDARRCRRRPRRVGFRKKGIHSAGVARQHNGQLGEEENRQLGVTPDGVALLDHQLYSHRS